MSRINPKGNYEVVKLEEFSGSETSIYSIYLTEEKVTLFDRFISENQEANPENVREILSRLMTISNKTGARESFFKLKEGKPGDGVCALYDQPEQHLRLYCIRYGNCMLILGGGGLKECDAWQDDPKLSLEASWMIRISAEITNRIMEGEIQFVNNGSDIEGDLLFEQPEE